jgi:hypothetical protein
MALPRLGCEQVRALKMRSVFADRVRLDGDGVGALRIEGGADAEHGEVHEEA